LQFPNASTYKRAVKKQGATADMTIFADREGYYGANSTMTLGEVKVYTAKNHTMKGHFWKYIGREGRWHQKISRDRIGRRFFDKPELDPKFKKFSVEQCNLLIEHYKLGHDIAVVGCWREDLVEIAKKNAATVKQTHAAFNRCTDTRNPKLRTFNTIRTQFFVVEKGGKVELWIAVFPSREYIDQTAELLAAIYSDFPKVRTPNWTRPKVSVCHFSELEKHIVKWTGFKSA
jgi:hypothetical protein